MIAALTAASPEELTSIRALLALPKEAKVKAEKAPKAPKVALPLPEGCPTAADYRLDPKEINQSLCVGRITKGGEDKRFKPIVYRESQCSKPSVEDGLCKTCAKRCAKYEETAKLGDWNGRVTEEPLDDCHMLGTVWAETKKPQFGAGSAAVSAAASAETSDAEEPKAAPKAEPKAAPKAEPKAKPAKETKKPAKEPKKAEKAEKAEKVAKEPKAKAAKAKAKVAKPEEVTSELVCLDGTVYMVKNGNVFEYDELAEAAGEYQGRLRDDKTIDTTAAQVESDTD